MSMLQVASMWGFGGAPEGPELWGSGCLSGKQLWLPSVIHTG